MAGHGLSGSLEKQPLAITPRREPKKKGHA